MKNLNTTRKTFLKNSLVTLASVITVPLFAKNNRPAKTVKMLTANGRLVEVNSDVVKKAPKKKAGLKEILDWRTLKG